MACQPGWAQGGALPSRSFPAWRDSRVTAMYSSAPQPAVKFSSLAYPASNSALPIRPGIPAAARLAVPAASSGCSAAVPTVLSWVPTVLSWVPTAKMTCPRPARACWSKPPSSAA
jgi:hypothetical protein